MFSNAVLVAGLLSAASAHMVMKSPVPYGAASLSNGPLAGDGSDFPCKQRSGVYDVTKMNSLAVGVPQTMSFMGSAVHGGGSCQVSITLDQQPTKQSTWKVIHSIVGGCPSNVTGNLPADPNGLGAATFDFKVPTDFPSGKATLAWTWLNKVGNREFYMNCAPVEITGGSSSKDAYNSLPDMFVANIGPQCGTAEGQDFVYPNPGSAAVTPFATALGSKTVGSGCQQPTGGAAPAKGVQQPGVAIAPAPTPVVASTAEKQTTLTTAVAATQPTPDSSLPDPIAAPQVAPVPAKADPAPAVAPAAPAAPKAASADSTTTTGSCTNGSVACSAPGAVVCIGTSQFGICDINNCAVPQQLALGTSCKNGAVSKRSLKRVARHLAAHQAM